jgi:hypothetical protein
MKYSRIILLIASWRIHPRIEESCPIGLSAEEGFRSYPKRADDFDFAQFLGVLEVFREQIATFRNLSSRDDQGIPPGKPVSVLKEPRPIHYPVIYGNRVPSPKRPDIAARRVMREAWFESFRDGYIVLLKDLEERGRSSDNSVIVGNP